MTGIRFIMQFVVILTVCTLALPACTTNGVSDVAIEPSTPPQLGVRLRPVPTPSVVTQQLKETPALQIPVFLIVKVKPGMGAEQAGVLEGDRLVMIGQTRIRGMLSAVAEMHKRSAGDSVRLTLVRDGRLVRIPVTLTP